MPGESQFSQRERVTAKLAFIKALNCARRTNRFFLSTPVAGVKRHLRLLPADFACMLHHVIPRGGNCTRCRSSVGNAFGVPVDSTLLVSRRTAPRSDGSGIRPSLSGLRAV